MVMIFECVSWSGRPGHELGKEELTSRTTMFQPLMFFRLLSMSQDCARCFSGIIDMSLNTAQFILLKMFHGEQLSKQEEEYYTNDQSAEETTLRSEEQPHRQTTSRDKYSHMLKSKIFIIGYILIALFFLQFWIILAKIEQAKKKEAAKLQNQLGYLQAKRLHTEVVLRQKIEQLEARAKNENQGEQLVSVNPNFLKRDVNNKGIADVLYKDEITRKLRREFYEERVRFVNLNNNVESLFLAKYNLILDQQTMQEGVQVNQEEWVRLEKKFKLSVITRELPMCIIVPGYNNNDRFRIESNLNSIFAQNYTNYRVVIVNDASNDGSGEVYRKYLDFYNIDRSRYVYVENQRRVTALMNIYLAVMHHCSMDSIAVTVDADDELIGRNALQVFNWGYQTLKSGVLYSNFIWYHQPVKAFNGWALPYTKQDNKQKNYRNLVMKFSQLRSFRTELLHQINLKDFKDSDGIFYTSTYDMVLFYPIMELSCGRVDQIEGEFHYLYNTGTGINDFSIVPELQNKIDNTIRAAKKYECFQQFNDRMNKL